MKIVCVGQNYADHVQEMGGKNPDQPVIFLKPESALLTPGQDFHLPDFSDDVHFEAELVYQISRKCEHGFTVDPHHCVDAVTVGIDFTARDLQRELKEKGRPWELAKSFDGSAIIGQLINIHDLKNENAIDFCLSRNGQQVQKGNSKDLLFGVPHLIQFISQYIMLAPGDLLFTGTPAGVGPLAHGDTLKGYLEDRPVLTCAVAGQWAV